MSKVEILKRIDTLKTSPAIFHVHVDQSHWNGPRLALTKAKPETNTPTGNDPLMDLIIDNFQEAFDHGTMSYKPSSSIVNAVEREIGKDILAVIMNNAEQIHPRETNIYKWYSSYVVGSERGMALHIDNLIKIWQYLFTNVGREVRHGNYDDKDKVHINNVLGLLTLIFDKHYKEEHLPQKKRRRRR